MDLEGLQISLRGEVPNAVCQSLGHSFSRLPLIHGNRCLTRTQSSDEAALLRDFLRNTASQLTSHGIQQLHDNVRERELAVFFRNNHFSVIFKYDGAVYLLVTDQVDSVLELEAY